MGSDVKTKRVNIFIDQTAASEALKKLQLNADGLNKKIAELQSNGKSAAAEMKKLGDTNSSIKKVQDQIDKGLKPSLSQQTTLVIKLRNELKRLSESDPQFKDKLKNYQQQNTELQRMNANVTGLAKSGEHLGGTFGKVFEHILEAFGAFKIIETVFENVKEFFSGSTEKAIEAESAFSRLQNILSNVGRTDIFEALKTDAEELSKKFKLFKADEVIEVFQKLITYGKLTQNQIEDLTPVIINFAIKQKISLAEATGVITKSLEGNNRGLREYGISVKDASTVTERFGIIMKDLKPRVEGAAEAFGDTTAGAIQKTKVQLGELQEKLGQQSLPLIKLYNVEWSKLLVTLNEFFDIPLSDQLRAEKLELNGLVESIISENANQQIRSNLISQLNAKYPEFLAGLKTELITTDQLKLRLETVNLLYDQRIENAIRLKSVEKFEETQAEALNSTSNAIAALQKGAIELGVNTSNFDLNSEKGILGFAKALQKQLDEIEKTDLPKFQQVTETIKSGFIDADGVFNNLFKSRNFVNLGDIAIDKFKDLKQANEDLSQAESQTEEVKKGQVETDKKSIETNEKEIKSLEKKRIETENLARANAKLVGIKFDASKDPSLLNIDNEIKVRQKNIEDLKKAAGIINDRNTILGNGNPDEDAGAAKKAPDQLNKAREDFKKILDQTAKDIRNANLSEETLAILKAFDNYNDKVKELTETADKGHISIDELNKAIAQQGDALKIALQNIHKNDPVFSVANLLPSTGELSDFPKKFAETIDKLPKAIAELPIKFTAELTPEEEAQLKQSMANFLQRLKTDNKAGLQLDVLNAGGPKQKRDALLKQLEDERTDVLANTNLTENQRAVIEKEFADKRKAIQHQYLVEVLDGINQGLQLAAAAVNTLSAFNDAKSAKENAALKKELDGNEKRKKAYQSQLDAKVISQGEFNQKVAALDADSEKKKAALEKEQGERKKKISIAQAIINGALGVTNALATSPTIFAGIVLAALVVATTAAQIASISAQKFAKGGKVEYAGNGKITKQSNIPTQSNGDDVLATVKRGEVVLNKQQQEALGGDETFRRIRVPGFASGGYLRPAYQTRAYKAVDYGNINTSYGYLKFADGGRVSSSAGGTTTITASDPALVSAIENMHLINAKLADSLDKIDRRFSKPIESNVSLKKFNDAQDLDARIKNNSQFK